MDERRRWHSRGYLPHYDGDVCQFITIRLADSLPQTVLERFKKEMEANRLENFYDREKQIRIEEFLDRGGWRMSPRRAGNRSNRSGSTFALRTGTLQDIFIRDHAEPCTLADAADAGLGIVRY